MAGPGIKSNSESNIPVLGVDILPTIVELAGNKSIKLPEIDGGSFASILNKNNQVKDQLMVSSFMFLTRMEWLKDLIQRYVRETISY